MNLPFDPLFVVDLFKGCYFLHENVLEQFFEFGGEHKFFVYLHHLFLYLLPKFMWLLRGNELVKDVCGTVLLIEWHKRGQHAK